MKRRHVIRLIGLAAAWPFAINADSRNVARVGVLWHAASADAEGIYFRTLRKAFSDLGYTEGKNIEFEDRFPAEEPERFSILAEELVKSKPDVIIAVTALGGKELQRLTGTIPIVFVIAADPVGAGFVDGLARPGRSSR